MMVFDWGFTVVFVTTSFLTALAALLVVTLLPSLSRRKLSDRTQGDDEDTVFLFDDGVLIDATPNARRLLAQGPDDLSDWHRLAALLAPRFPDFTNEMANLSENGMTMLLEKTGRASLRARFSGGVSRISLIESQGSEDAGIDPQSLAALNSELDILRQIVTHVPTLAWQQNAQGDVTWANRAYLQLVEETLPEEDELVWPLPRLFDAETGPAAGNDMAPHRVSLALPDRAIQWFDCMAVSSSESPIFFALRADATVKAETSLRNFVQTLTKTFADLPTGLAIFNRARQLVLFNPALTDLCALEPQFLIGRPTLSAFLDRLRENRMMPEPKDYKSWRQQMSQLEEKAASGVYQETWTLPGGQTYRVSGRPHPDGAVAFLFEDISAEISLTRRFRSELDMNQAVLDSLDEAIAVFSPAGILTLSNAAYVRMWNSDPAHTLGDVGIHDAIQHWQDGCAPTNMWQDAQSFVTHFSERNPWDEQIQQNDGTRLKCRFQPIGGGATLVGFSKTTKSTARDPHEELPVSRAAI